MVYSLKWSAAQTEVRMRKEMASRTRLWRGVEEAAPPAPGTTNQPSPPLLLLLFVVVVGGVIVDGVVVVVVVDVIELLLLPNIVRMVEDTVDVGLVKLESCSRLECKRKARIKS